MFEKVGLWITRHPRAIIAVFFLLTPIFAFGIDGEMRPVTENNLRGNDTEVSEYEAVVKVFRENNTAAFVLVCNGTGGVFEEDCISRTREMARMIENSSIVAPDAVVISFPDYDHIEADGGDLIRVGSLVPEKIPSSEGDLKALSEKVMSDSLLRGKLVSNDGNASLVIFRLSDEATQNEVYDELAHFRDFFDDGEAYEAGVFASHFQNRAFELAAEKEFRVLGIIALTLILFFLWASLGFSAALLSITAITISIVWSLGILGWFGVLQNVLTSSLPVVLVAIISSPAFHLLNTMRRAWQLGASTSEAVTETFKGVVPSIFGSTVTTVFGFLSLVVIPVYSLAEFGLFVTAGIVAGSSAVVFLLPALALVILPSAITSKEGRVSQFIRAGIASFLFQSKKPLCNRSVGVAVVLSSLVVIVIATFGAFRVEVGSSPPHFIPKGDKVREGFDLLKEKFGGTALIPIMVDCGSEGLTHDFECLRFAEKVSAYAETLPDVAFATSLADRVKRLNRVMEGGDAEHEVVPESAKLIEQLLVLDNREVLREFQDESGRYLKLGLFIYAYDSVRIGKMRDAIRAYVKREGISYRIYFGGEYMLWARMIEVIGDNGLKSPALVGLFLFVFCGLYFKSVKLGLLSLLPVGTAALVVLAIMGALEIRLDIANVAIATIAGAMTVDFYIHFISRVQQIFQMRGRIVEALEDAFNEVGTPILFDCMTNLSFVVLVFSEFVPVRNLGWLLCVAMVVAVTMTLGVVPSIIALFPRVFFKNIERRVAIEKTIRRVA